MTPGILLGSVRKYAAIVQTARGTPISGLHYFSSVLEEVQQEISHSVLEICGPKGDGTRVRVALSLDT
jgi:hypothetical protein